MVFFKKTPSGSPSSALPSVTVKPQVSRRSDDLLKSHNMEPSD
jgi:hypothetical protein